MSWYALLFGHDGWSGLLLNGALVTIALALTTVPFGFGAHEIDGKKYGVMGAAAM